VVTAVSMSEMGRIEATVSCAENAQFEALWREHYPALRRFCAAIVGAGEADDIATDALLRCREALASGRVSNPRAYLFRAATNAVHNLRRGRGREQVRAST
jgi:DNA-directed RNA polymerase specialized sigma24 family protein